MKPMKHTQDTAGAAQPLLGATERQAARHASRAGTTFARFVQRVADAGGYSIADAKRNAVAVIATLEERLPIREVCNLEAQLPTRLDSLLAFEPLNGLPAMDRAQFCERVAARAGVTSAEAESVAGTIFAVLRSLIAGGEVRHVADRLPEDLMELWSNSR